MIALSDFPHPQEAVPLDQSVDSIFDPGPHFAMWLRALETFRHREHTEAFSKVYLEDGDRDDAAALSFDDQLPDQVCADGTLVVTEQGQLRADVDVTVAVIDGLFKGKITANEQVILGNHAVVIGDINTPALTIRGGAIVEGRCYFERPERPAERWERPGWQAFKLGFAKVWRAGSFGKGKAVFSFRR